jgi:hypothetical protein
MKSIGLLNQLEFLNLDYTNVSDEGLIHLKPLRQLKTLRLDSAKITDSGSRELQAHRQLEHLNLYHTLVTEQGYELLKKALPGCEIVWDRDSALPTRRGS